MAETVAKWEAPELPTTKAEYDKWKPVILARLGQVDEDVKDWAGKLVWHEREHYGEPAAHALVKELVGRFDVTERTVARWVVGFSDKEGLTSELPRPKAQKERRQKEALMSARHKSEPAPVVPDEVIDPPTKSATPHEPAHEQMAFDWPVEVTDIITRALRLMTPEQLVKVVKNGIGQYATATPARGRGQVESRLKK